MKYKKYLLLIFLTLSFFLGSTALASHFLILEVQTTGAAGAYDEFVKIQNNTGQTINLSGYRLQSQSSSGGNWVNRTGTDGLPILAVGPNQTFIIAPKDYSGSNEIYRHTARWGFADAGGGVRFQDADGNVLAEEHWSGSSGLVVFHQPVTESPPVVGTPPAVEPAEPADFPATDDTDFEIVPEAQTPIVTPSPEGEQVPYGVNSVEGSQTTQESDEISRLPSVARNDEENNVARNDEENNVARNDDSGAIKTAKGGSETSKEVLLPPKAGEESVVKSPSSPPPLLKGEDVKSPSASPFDKGGLGGISEIKKLKNDSKVKVRGIVSVPPGVLGSQIFYLSGSGIQVYMFKKDFPDLKVGDVIEVDGELSEAYGEKRIKLASRDSIKLVSSGQAPAPHQSAIQEIGEDLEGSLVAVGGEIVETSKEAWYLIDGEQEIKIVINSGTNIPYDFIEEGDKVEIIGIVSQRNDEYRLLPRGVGDIKIIEKYDSEILAQENQEKRNFGVKDYLFVGIPSLLAAGFLAVRRRMAKNKNSKNPLP